MFGLLTIDERHELLMKIMRGCWRAIEHEEVRWRYGVIDDCYEILREL